MKALKQFADKLPRSLSKSKEKIHFEGGRKKGKVGVLLEFLIEKSLFVCGSLSVIFVFFILSYLFVRAYPLFDVGDETRPMYSGRFNARLQENEDKGDNWYTFSIELSDTITVSEITRNPDEWNGQKVYVTGSIANNSVNRGKNEFILEDDFGELRVISMDDLPTNIGDGVDVTVVGYFNMDKSDGDDPNPYINAMMVTITTRAYTVTDLREGGDDLVKVDVELVGIVENGTLDLADRTCMLRDFAPLEAANISLNFKDILPYKIPGNLEEGVSVTVSGSLRKKGDDYYFRAKEMDVGGSKPGVYQIVVYRYYETKEQDELFRDEVSFEGDERTFKHSLDYEVDHGTRVTIVISWNGTQQISSIHVADPSLWDFVTGMDWNPTGRNPAELEYFGARPLIVGSILVTIGAMLFAIPLGIGAAIYIAELAPPRVRDILKTGSELLAGIPSVVYGLFGLLILVNWIHVTFDKPTGETWLAGSILLGIMALPTIISVSEDAISSVSRELKEGSLALGATKWQTITRVIIPSSISGITAAIILGIGRAVGETMAVMMVTGNAPQIPNPITNVFTPVKTLTGAIGVEMGEAAVGSNHQFALFMVAVILFFMVLIINSSAVYLMKNIKEKHYGKPKKAKSMFSLPDSFTRKFKPVRNAITRYKWNFFLVVSGIFMFWLITAWFGFVFGTLIFIGIIAFNHGSKKLDPKRFQWVGYSAVTGAMIVVLFLLSLILYYIIDNGWSKMSIEFLTESPKDSGREGGIYPAIIGTLMLTGGAIAISTPLGVGAGIYLAEYARESRALQIIRTGIDNLNGTPSIVFGLFGYAFLVLYLDMGTSLKAGQITLAFMVLPTIIRTTEEALKSVPLALREGSLALGATKWETTRRVVLPPAMPGIITGIILSVGRAAGETAPIMFTAVALTRQDPYPGFDEPVMALPYFILEMSMNIPGGKEAAAGAALVLLLLVLTFYLGAALIRKRFEKGLKGFR